MVPLVDAQSSLVVGRGFENSRGRIRMGHVIEGIPSRMGYMIMILLIFNPFNLIDVWTKMSVMAKHATHGTWVIGLKIFPISWWFGIGIVLSLLRWWRKRVIPILLIFLWGVF